MVQAEITFLGMPSCESVTQWVNEATEKLARHASLQSVNLTVAAHGAEHKTFTAHLHVTKARADFVATHDDSHGHRHRTVWLALDDAFSSVRRQIDDAHRRRVSRTKHHRMRA